MGRTLGSGGWESIAQEFGNNRNNDNTSKHLCSHILRLFLDFRFTGSLNPHNNLRYR